MAVFKFTEPSGEEHLTWCEGELTGVVSKGRTRRTQIAHRVFWIVEGVYQTLVLDPSLYNTRPDAANGSWFLVGTQAQLESLHV